MLDVPAPRIPHNGPGNPNYPLGGRVTGPAWRRIWELLKQQGEEFTLGGDLAAEASKASDGSAETARQLLIRAANAGILERYAGDVEGRLGARRNTFYRISPEWMAKQ